MKLMNFFFLNLKYILKMTLCLSTEADKCATPIRIFSKMIFQK